MEKHYAIGTHKPKKRRPRKALMLIWREQMGFTQRDAVVKLGCSKGALIGWELGRHELPLYVRYAMNALAVGMPPFGAKPISATNGEE